MGESRTIPQRSADAAREWYAVFIWSPTSELANVIASHFADLEPQTEREISNCIHLQNQRIATLVGLLKEYEFCYLSAGRDGRTCMCCDGINAHAPDCRLAQAIKEPS